MTPKVSVLIPCFNAASWIAQTLESTFAQTWPNLEVIVVDDGSTDESVTVIRKYLDRGLQLHCQPNKGAAAARNAAMAMATGQWLQFLDADDLLAHDKIEKQLSIALPTGDDFAWCCNWTRFEDTTDDAGFSHEPLCRDSDPVEWVIVKLEQNRMMHPAAWLISRNLADRAGTWNESLSLDDDGEYFTRVVLASRGVRCCAQATSFYRSGIPGSLSGRKSERALQSAFESTRRCAELLIAREDSPRTRTAAATALQRFIFDAYPDAPHCRTAAEALVGYYGGCNTRPDGGPLFRRISNVLGWKFAKQVQRRLRS